MRGGEYEKVRQEKGKGNRGKGDKRLETVLYPCSI
jgi:hypothetical protein